MHRQVLLNINDQINLSLVQQIQSLWLLSRFRWPVNPRIGYTILFEELTGATSGIEFIAMCNQLFGSIKHINFLFCTTCRKQYCLLRNSLPYRQHAFQQRGIRIISQTANFSRRAHINTQHRIGLLQTVERELTGLDAHIIKVEKVLTWLLNRQSKHHSRGQFYKINLQHLTYKWE